MSISTPSPSSSPSTASVIFVWCMVLLLRVLIGYQPHSGQDNFHGSKKAYGGDYEAQRHWMELTLHLPVSEWYWYDLEYWGLDYPPLTAFVSYICGYMSQVLVGPETVALMTSRGYEDPMHKAYMRLTVLVLDILLYCSIVHVVTRKYQRTTSVSLWTLALALSQPALILMDHGHFQYNSVSLGFALWSFYYCTKASFFPHCLIGSILFCCALNFKQMTLYYAPAIFAYLLGRCFAKDNSSKVKNHEYSVTVKRFASLGLTVVSMFCLLWWPFVYYAHEETTVVDRVTHVVHRMFPFQRGLFEGKVSNLWCALSVRPISIRQRLPESTQPVVALFVTLLLILPACWKLFQVGRCQPSFASSNINGRQMHEKYQWTMLLWGTASTGLAFFLASFQVHEKSILMALAPISLLLWEDILWVCWFSVVALWTLWPLICVDRLQVAYFCMIVLYSVLIWLFHNDCEDASKTIRRASCLDHLTTTKAIIPLSLLGMMTLHVLEVFVTPPTSLPDLFPVLWSIAGCGMFCISWLITCWHLYTHEVPDVHHDGTDAKFKVKMY